MHGSFANLLRGEFTRAVEHRQLNILEGGGAREEVEALEYEAEFLVADIGESVAVEFGNIDPVEEVATTRGPIKAAQQIHQRRFARAAGAHQGHKITALDLERNPAHRVDGDLAGIVDFVDFLYFNNGRHGRRAGSWKTDFLNGRGRRLGCHRRRSRGCHR